MNTNTNKGLTIFQLTQPSFDGLLGFKQTERKGADDKVVGVTLTMEGVSETAKRLQKPQKSQEVADARMELSTRIKEAGVGEALKMLSSPAWTGASVRMTENKKGIKRFALALISVPDARQISRDNMAKELAKMSEDEQQAILEQAEEIKKAKHTIEV